MSGAKFKVLVVRTRLGFPSEDFIEELRKRLSPNCELTIASVKDKNILRLVSDVDILVSSRGSRKLIESAKKLKMIQAVGTGVDRIDIGAASERGVIVCNAVGLNAVAVAEHTFSLILALSKNLPKHDRELRRGVWRGIPSKLLKNKVLGIVGLGSIGVEIAERAKAFGMRVIGIKRHPSEEFRVKLGIAFLGGPDDLPRVLKEGDFVVLSVVVTPETRRMMGERELRMMKKTAYLVNVSRGAVLDEEALIRILKERTIAGAGLDVFENEPINPENPLLKLENVVMTPHVAGGASGGEFLGEQAEFVAQNIGKTIKGETPKNIVDPILKYALKSRK